MFLGGLIDAIPKVFYLLTMSILSIIDLFQLLMRKLAGLDCYYVDDTAQSGDIVYDFLTGIFSGAYPILSTVFWGLVILGFILLFLSTIIAIIRSEYTTEKADNGKGKIMFKAFKSVVFFAIVPIVTIVGVYLANLVLVAVDKATTPNTNNYSYLDKSKLQSVKVVSYSFGQESTAETYVTYSLFGYKDSDNLPYGTTTTTFSGTIFKASAYNANRVRSTSNETDDTKNFANLLKTNQVTTFNNLFYEESGDIAELATKIDIAFADNVVFKTATTLDFSSQYIKNTNNLLGDPFPSQENIEQTCADKFNVQLVWYYYDLWQFNFIIAVGAATICATIFINIIFGLMKRIVEMIGLFLVAPPLIGLMPLDNEKAYNNWRGSFIKKALMAYGAIGGMNIIFILLPELQTIKFFNVGQIDWIVDTLLVLVALLAIKDFIALISTLVGGEDANAVGEKVGKDLGDLAGKAVKLGATVVGGAAGLAKTGAKAVAFTGKKVGQAGQYGYHALRGDSVAKHASALNRAEHAGEDKSSATDYVFDKIYKQREDNRNKAEQDLVDRHGWDYLKKLGTDDPEQYQKMFDEQLRKNFEYTYEKDKTAKGDELREETTRKFNELQKDRNVTHKDVAKDTALGKILEDNKDYRANIKDLKAKKKAGVGGINGFDIHHAKWEGWKSDARLVGGVGKDLVSIAQPAVSTGKNVLGEIAQIYTSNSFYEGFMGKEKDTLADTAYRLAGTNKKAVDKLKAKEKELKAQQEQLAAQQQMILNALRQIEAERHKH